MINGKALTGIIALARGDKSEYGYTQNYVSAMAAFGNYDGSRAAAFP